MSYFIAAAVAVATFAICWWGFNLGIWSVVVEITMYFVLVVPLLRRERR